MPRSSSSWSGWEVDPSADGIAVGAPFSAAMVLRDVREADGGFVAVTDEALLRAIQTLASEGGVLAEPAAAAAFAGIDPAVEAGLCSREERIVALVTGTGLKNLQYLRPQTAPFEVQGTLEEVGAVLALSIPG
jgi:threonine synthase